MVWIVAHAVLGLAVIAWVVRVNPLLRKRPPEGPALSALEATYLFVGLASWVLPNERGRVLDAGSAP